MEVKDWRQIEDIFHVALDLVGAERDAYLVGACSSDADLHGEVKSLLAAFEARGGFLEEPVFSLGLRVLPEDPAASLAGSSVGPYKLIETLGKGGMGEVYLAEDARLGRKVALKFLSPRLVDDNWAKRQLIREAQAVAMLNHPNICTVHGIEDIDGHSFIVMQHVEGETLSGFIRSCHPDVRQSLTLAVQMAGAISEAHAHGIIHRDLKPQNVVIGADGQAKVLDFGLAKLVQRQQDINVADSPSQVSQAGLVMGTVAYMSPEQLRAERLDFRSDIFSLGIVLYELFGGTNPFARESDADTISAILMSEPAPLTQSASGVWPELSRIVLKCLEKDREQRYQSASELLYDLGTIQARGAPRPRRWPHLTPRAAAFIALLVLIIAVSALFVYLRQTRVHTLAVLPIVNDSGDPGLEYLGDGLTEALNRKLSGLSKLQVKAPTVVAGYKGREFDPQQVGRDLRVEAVMVGRLVRQGEALVLQTRLVETRGGSQLWGRSYDVKLEDISELQREVSEQVAAGLELSLGQKERDVLAAPRVQNPAAIGKYMNGRYYLNRRSEENILIAIRFFEEAIVLEPRYPEAHAGLADCYVYRPSPLYGGISTEESMRKAKGAAGLALSLDDSLPEAHTSMGIVQLRYEWNWEEARRAFKRAIEINPDYAPAHNGYSNLLAITGHFEEAIAESAISKNLDPSSPSETMNHCRAIFLSRQYDRAEACFNEMLSVWPEHFGGQYILGLVYFEKGRYEESLRIFQKLYATNKKSAATLGYVYGRLGRRAEALKLLDELKKRYEDKSSGLPAQEVAIVYVGLGDKDNAFAWLEKAYQEKFGPLIYLGVEPLFDSLRSDARYHDLMRRLNLAPPA